MFIFSPHWTVVPKIFLHSNIMVWGTVFLSRSLYLKSLHHYVLSIIKQTSVALHQLVEEYYLSFCGSISFASLKINLIGICIAEFRPGN